MVLRLWHGRTRPQDAAAYQLLLTGQIALLRQHDEHSQHYLQLASFPGA